MLSFRKIGKSIVLVVSEILMDKQRVRRSLEDKIMPLKYSVFCSLDEKII